MPENEPGPIHSSDLSQIPFPKQLPCPLLPAPWLQAGSPYHEVSDGVGIGRRKFPHAVVGHRSDAQHPLLLEHPAGQGDGQLVITGLRVSADGGRPRKDGSHAKKIHHVPKNQTLIDVKVTKSQAGLKEGIASQSTLLHMGKGMCPPQVNSRFLLFP